MIGCGPGQHREIEKYIRDIMSQEQFRLTKITITSVLIHLEHLKQKLLYENNLQVKVSRRINFSLRLDNY